MTNEAGYGVLTDAQWEKLAPLIEACRPHHKTECVDLRRTIEAIIWRHTNGAKWRSIPPHLAVVDGRTNVQSLEPLRRMGAFAGAGARSRWG